MILESNKEFNVIFIQEPLWLFICSISSSSSNKEDRVVDTSNHPEHLQMIMTILESFPILIFDFLIYVFLCERIF